MEKEEANSIGELEDILSRLEKVFNEAKIKYVIVGAIAVIHYGFVRATQDIDLILEDNEHKFPKFLEILKVNDFDVIEEQFFLGYKERSNISVFDKKSSFRLDIKIANKKAELEVLTDALQHDILGYHLCIAPLEHVLIGKMLYMGDIMNIPESELYEYQDVIDFLTVYNANRDKIDENLLTKKSKELGLISTLKRLKNLIE